MKKKRRIRYDPLDKLDMLPPEPPDQNPMAHIHAQNRRIHSLECDGYTGLECYNYLLQHPERCRAATCCDGQLGLEAELDFRRIAFALDQDGKVIGELDADQRAQLAQIQPPITEAELVEIIEEQHGEFIRKREAEEHGTS